MTPVTVPHSPKGSKSPGLQCLHHNEGTLQVQQTGSQTAVSEMPGIVPSQQVSGFCWNQCLARDVARNRICPRHVRQVEWHSATSRPFRLLSAIDCMPVSLLISVQWVNRLQGRSVVKKKSCSLSCLSVCFCLMVCAAMPSFVLGQEPGTEKEQDRNAREALERFIAVDFQDERLGEILDEWSGQQGVKFLLHRSASQNNLGPDTLITLSVPEVRLATALSLMLDETECTWLVRDGIVQIVSDDYAVENPVIESVDCEGILATIKPVKRQRLDSRPEPGRSGGVFSVSPREAPGPEQREPAGNLPREELSQTVTQLPASQYFLIEEVISAEEQLIELIQEIVDPDSWEANGGTGRMQVMTGKLFVVTTCENQRRVKALLDELKPVNE